MDDPQKQLAHELFLKAFEYQMQRDFAKAIELYEKSIATYPTAQAYTFLGWTYSFKEEYQKAIELCLKAIELDPQYGNPYNDIGSYYIHLRQFEEAIPYLQRAIDAPNYDARHYAHYNLGRVYERQGRWFDAVEEYKRSIEIEPKYKIARDALQKLQAQMN